MSARPKNPARPFVVDRPEQRAALASPIRMEILGQFTSPEGLSIADTAERMGRPATALYYHFAILERVGLLVRSGDRRAGKRRESVYRPVAPRIEVRAEPPEDAPTLVKTAASAFRMAERDLKAGLTEGTARTGGTGRNFFMARMHCRVSRRTLEKINRHLDAIIDIAEREGCGSDTPRKSDEHCSVTLALLPLRGRRTPPTRPHPEEPR